ELSYLVRYSRSPFVRQHFTSIAVNQVSEGMLLGFGCLEVTTFEDSTFCHLCPFFGFREFGEGRSLWGCAFASHPHEKRDVSILTGSANDSSHTYLQKLRYSYGWEVSHQCHIVETDIRKTTSAGVVEW